MNALERIGDANTSGALCLILGAAVIMFVAMHLWGKR
jgi:hypothetical protein